MGTRPFGGIDVSFRLVHCPLRGEFYPRHGCFVVGVSCAFLVLFLLRLGYVERSHLGDCLQVWSLASGLKACRTVQPSFLSS